MSRLTEAMRRTGQGAKPENDQGVFVSPWGDAPAPPPVVDKDRFAPRVARIERPAELRPGTEVSLSRTWRERLATADGNPVMVEQFRRLAATLHHAQNGSGIKTIMFTSASPNDGKTLTAVNLALVMSESYHRRVLLIDADLRRPSLGRVADLSDSPGLSEALKSSTEQKLAILQVSPNLMLLPAGRPDPDPMGALTSDRMRHIIEEAAGRFDWVILDAPPMGPMADAGLLSHMVDGAVFVIRAGQSQYSAVRNAIDVLGRERILGVVLNGVTDLPPDHYGYTGYEYSGGDKQPRP